MTAKRHTNAQLLRDNDELRQGAYDSIGEIARLKARVKELENLLKLSNEDAEEARSMLERISRAVNKEAGEAVDEAVIRVLGSLWKEIYDNQNGCWNGN